MSVSTSQLEMESQLDTSRHSQVDRKGATQLGEISMPLFEPFAVSFQVGSPSRADLSRFLKYRQPKIVADR
jgi:hypothetical protein